MAGWTPPEDAEMARLREELAKLSDPASVRVNILRGTIKTPDDLVWLHDTNGPVATLRAQLAAALAAKEEAERRAHICETMILARGTNRDYQQSRAEHAEARVAALEAGLQECADDLEAELKARHLQADGKPHPALAHDFERDMAPVRNARALLAEKPA